MLKIDNLSKTFTLEDQKIIALQDVTLEVQKAEFFTIVGPSGCGKSTLLRIIAGLTPPTSGQLLWQGAETLSFVFQNYALLPFLTAFENIEFGLKMRGVEEGRRAASVKDLIEEVGLSGYADKHPKELSGGMKQRVGIARALAIEPTVLLLDEPFSSLDEFTAQTLRKLLVRIWQKRKVTVVMVTHLVREALELSDRIAVMTPAPGRVEEVVVNDLPHPRNLRSKELFSLEDRLLALVKG